MEKYTCWVCGVPVTENNSIKLKLNETDAPSKIRMSGGILYDLPEVKKPFCNICANLYNDITGLQNPTPH